MARKGCAESLTQVRGGEDTGGGRGLALGLIHVYFCPSYTSLWNGLMPTLPVGKETGLGMWRCRSEMPRPLPLPPVHQLPLLREVSAVTWTPARLTPFLPSPPEEGGRHFCSRGCSLGWAKGEQNAPGLPKTSASQFLETVSTLAYVTRGCTENGIKTATQLTL